VIDERNLKSHESNQGHRKGGVFLPWLFIRWATGAEVSMRGWLEIDILVKQFAIKFGCVTLVVFWCWKAYHR